MIEYKNLCGVTLELPERGLVLDCFSMSLPSAETVEIDDTDLCSKFRKTFSARAIGLREFNAVIRYRPNRHLPLGEKSEPLYVNMPQVGDSRTRFTTIGHMYGVHLPTGDQDMEEVSVSFRVDAPMMELPIPITTAQTIPILPVTDPTLWVDASTLTSSPVASWTDLSGFNRHMVKLGTGTPTVQFADQNGMNVVQYAAASQQAHMSASDPLQHTSNESFTAFCVMKKTQSGAANGVLNGRGNAQYNGWGFSLQSNGFYVVISEAWAQYGSAFTDTSPSGSTVISAGRKSGTALRSRRVDSAGSDDTYNATSASGTIRASTGYNLQAGIDNNNAYVSEKLCEVLVYRRALSDDEFSAVVAYLKDKWITP